MKRLGRHWCDERWILTPCFLRLVPGQSSGCAGGSPGAGTRGSSLESYFVLSLLLWAPLTWAPGGESVLKVGFSPEPLTQGSWPARSTIRQPSGLRQAAFPPRFLISDSDEPCLQCGPEGFRVCWGKRPQLLGVPALPLYRCGMRLSKEKQEGMWEHRPPPNSVHLGRLSRGRTGSDGQDPGLAAVRPHRAAEASRGQDLAHSPRGAAGGSDTLGSPGRAAGGADLRVCGVPGTGGKSRGDGPSPWSHCPHPTHLPKACYPPEPHRHG